MKKKTEKRHKLRFNSFSFSLLSGGLSIEFKIDPNKSILFFGDLIDANLFYYKIK